MHRAFKYNLPLLLMAALLWCMPLSAAAEEPPPSPSGWAASSNTMEGHCLRVAALTATLTLHLPEDKAEAYALLTSIGAELARIDHITSQAIYSKVWVELLRQHAEVLADREAAAATIYTQVHTACVTLMKSVT